VSVRVAAALVACLVCTPRAAFAGSNDGLVVEARFGGHIIANGQNYSGGWGPSILAVYDWDLGGHAHVGLGLDGALFGLGRGSYWVGVLGGPVARVAGRPWQAPVDVALTVSGDFARVAICNEWPRPLCPHEIGFAPGFTLAALYATDGGGSYGLSLSAQVYNGAFGTIVSWAPQVTAQWPIGGSK